MRLKILPRGTNGPPPELPTNIVPRHRVERGRKNVSRACQPCRQRRIKCTTSRPCRSCQVHGVECSDNDGSGAVDLRTVRADTHDQQVLMRQKALLNSLLRSIRAGTSDTVIACIKDGGTLAQVSRALEAVERLPIRTKKHDDADDETSPAVEEFVFNGEPSQLSSSANVDDSDANVVTKFGNLPLSSAIKANGFSADIQHQQLMHLTTHSWECAPLTSDDASVNDAFSRSCLSFRNLARQQLGSGGSPDLILSLGGIEMDLLFRHRVASDPHTVSTWACELLKTFDFLHPVVKLAGAEAVACLMRWLIAPTMANYLTLPVTSKPTSSQLFIPHSIGVDIMMFPEIRDALLIRDGASAWTSIVSPTTMSFNWPYSIDACLEVVSQSYDGESQRMLLSKAFMEHIRDLNNLTLDRVVLTSFPEFEGKFQWHDSTPVSDSV